MEGVSSRKSMGGSTVLQTVEATLYVSSRGRAKGMRVSSTERQWYKKHATEVDQ